MGVDDRGRAGVVTNVRDPAASLDGASRGHLVADYLRGTGTAAAYESELAAQAADYRPFNLLWCDAGEAYYLGNHPHLRRQRVVPGVHGLSNADFNAPWPKTRKLVACLRTWIDAGDDDFDRLFDALADDSRWPDAVLPDTGVGIELERELSAAFIRGNRYGTRASTLIAVDHDGKGCIIERRFGSGGVVVGDGMMELGG